MPQSLDLAAFVFGAVLILLSLVAGSFKLFGAEVQGKVGTVGRVIAFVLGLILITSRLVPTSMADAHAKADGGSAPVKEAAVIAAPAPADDDDTSPSPAGAAIDTPPRELILGTWQGQYGLADNKIRTKIRYDKNGTFTGVLTYISKGLTTQLATQGTWRIRPLEPGRFQLTTRDKERPEPESYAYRVLDHDRFRNEDLSYVAHRVAGE